MILSNIWSNYQSVTQTLFWTKQVHASDIKNYSFECRDRSQTIDLDVSIFDSCWNKINDPYESQFTIYF